MVEGGEHIGKGITTYCVVLESAEKKIIRSLEDMIIQKIIRDHNK